ncbi:MAG: LysM peptidoglycan-binding domain-containing protein [Verrucomicrobia bacterium]|nr:LysM peptidoglycan-binding domain-containing protein [Verrucomicrobiota bacterium]
MERRARRRLDAWIVVAIVHVGIALLLISSTGGCGHSTKETGDTTMAPTPEDIDIRNVDTVYEVDDAPVVVSDRDDTVTHSVRSTTSVTPGNEVRYVVQAGDSLWKISRKFGVSVEAIADRNDISDTSLIREGRELWIPNPTKTVGQTPTSPATGTTTTPTVTETTVTDPAGTDPAGTDPTTTETMLIDTTTDTTVIDPVTGEATTPVETTPPVEPVNTGTVETIEYVVQPGDTLWKLAREYHTTTKIIMDLNGITDPRKMRAGDTILVPRPVGQ